MRQAAQLHCSAREQRQSSWESKDDASAARCLSADAATNAGRLLVQQLGCGGARSFEAEAQVAYLSPDSTFVVVNLPKLVPALRLVA